MDAHDPTPSYRDFFYAKVLTGIGVEHRVARKKQFPELTRLDTGAFAAINCCNTHCIRNHLCRREAVQDLVSGFRRKMAGYFADQSVRGAPTLLDAREDFVLCRSLEGDRG
jgi:hypothetical protein